MTGKTDDVLSKLEETINHMPEYLSENHQRDGKIAGNPCLKNDHEKPNKKQTTCSLEKEEEDIPWLQGTSGKNWMIKM